eukprot:751863-Hanusia_phi.AAC.2
MLFPSRTRFTMLAPDPAYEAYVKAAGIDGESALIQLKPATRRLFILWSGSTDFHINGVYNNYSGWDFPSVRSSLSDVYSFSLDMQSKGVPVSVFQFGSQPLGDPILANPDGLSSHFTVPCAEMCLLSGYNPDPPVWDGILRGP